MLTDPGGVNELTKSIIGCAVRVHRVIGPGVFESVYNECMQWELQQKRLAFALEHPVPLIYQGQKLKSRFYVDMVVEERVVVELKAVSEIIEVHRRQVLTQLRLMGLHVGLIINFNVPILTNGGVKRVVNPLADPAPSPEPVG